MEDLVTAIIIMYEDTTANVITPDGETATFKILAGVLQEDTLALYLFVIVIYYVMRTDLLGREDKLGFQLRKIKSRRVSPIMIQCTVRDMNFADDNGLVIEGIKYQKILTRVNKSAKRVGISMNRENEIHELQYQSQVLNQNYGWFTSEKG